jgi:hypothetical protein
MHRIVGIMGGALHGSVAGSGCKIAGLSFASPRSRFLIWVNFVHVRFIGCAQGWSEMESQEAGRAGRKLPKKLQKRKYGLW